MSNPVRTPSGQGRILIADDDDDHDAGNPRKPSIWPKKELKPAYDHLTAAIEAEVYFNKESGDEFSPAIHEAIRGATSGIWIGLGMALLVGTADSPKKRVLVPTVFRSG